MPLDKPINVCRIRFVIRESRSIEPAQTIQEWMERTGTNGRQLLALLRERGQPMTEGHLSNVLKGSRRCSLQKAIVLHEITGVPIRSIAKWPKADGEVRNVRSSTATASVSEEI